jgi:hypothetical protein
MVGNEGVNFIFFAGFALLNQKALFLAIQKMHEPISWMGGVLESPYQFQSTIFRLPLTSVLEPLKMKFKALCLRRCKASYSTSLMSCPTESKQLFTRLVSSFWLCKRMRLIGRGNFPAVR